MDIGIDTVHGAKPKEATDAACATEDIPVDHADPADSDSDVIDEDGIYYEEDEDAAAPEPEGMDKPIECLITNATCLSCQNQILSTPSASGAPTSSCMLPRGRSSASCQTAVRNGV